MGRKKLNTVRVNFLVDAERLATFKQHAISSGYVNGNGVLLGEVLGAIAELLENGKLKLPQRNI